MLKSLLILLVLSANVFLVVSAEDDPETTEVKSSADSSAQAESSSNTRTEGRTTTSNASASASAQASANSSVVKKSKNHYSSSTSSSSSSAQSSSNSTVVVTNCKGQCKKNERWVECPPILCVPATCDQLGKSIPCPRIIPGRCPVKPACVCIEGYVRNKNGICIPKKQCPSCGGDSNAEAGCGFLCGKRCGYSETTSPTPCPCAINGCSCKSGLYYDDKQRKCVPPTKCTDACPKNEEYTSCVNGGCGKWNCTQIDQPDLCIDPIKCIGGCKCKKGYLRGKEGVCIPQEECRKNLCPKPNEVYDNCPLTCPQRKCGFDDRAALCAPNLPCQPAGCRCQNGFYRNNEDICVAWEDCPKPCPRNEVYTSCANGGCRKWNCTQIDEPILCIDPIKCIGGCICKKGYLRGKNGRCIPQEQCRKHLCPKPNEVYDACPLECPPRKCGINDAAVLCLADQPCLPAGCRCKDGFYKNNKEICVAWEDCPPSCEDKEITTTTEEPIITTVTPGACVSDGEQRIVDANVKFTGLFLNEAMKTKPGENLIMSAFSLFPPIANLAFGSEGDTRAQFLNTLNLPSVDDIKCVFPKLLGDMSDQENVILRLASQIFVSDAYPLAKRFIDFTREVFNTILETLNFNNPSASANRINEWAANATNDRIKNIVTPDAITPQTRLILANAIYFLGNWTHQFNEDNTQDRDFYVSKDKTVKVPTMFQQNTFKYGEDTDLDCKILEMFYKGGNFSFLVFLPNDNDGVQALAEKIGDPNKFYKAYNSLTYEKVRTYIPRIKIESQYDLVDIMQKAGITDAFSPGKSKLTGLLENSKDELIISAIIQKAFIEVNEKGTEAAAANVLGAIACSKELDDRLIARNVIFTRIMFADVVKNFPGVSLVMSPFSMLFSFALLELYTTGNSNAQLVSLLNISDPNEIRCIFPFYLQVFTEQQNNDLDAKLYARYYINKNFVLTKPFQDDSVKMLAYNSESSDFSNANTAANNINAWIAGESNNRIPNVVTAAMLKSTTLMAGMNCVTFKSSWLVGFDPKRTTTRKFTISSTKSVNLRTMNRKGPIEYAEISALQAKIIVLPFKSSNLTFIIILPNTVSGYPGVVEKLRDPKVLDSALAALKTENVNLYLPIFNSNFTFELSPYFKQQSVTNVFDANTANLVGVSSSSGKLAVSFVQHKVNMVIQEEGGPDNNDYSKPATKTFDAAYTFIYFVRLLGDVKYCGIFAGS